MRGVPVRPRHTATDCARRQGPPSTSGRQSCCWVCLAVSWCALAAPDAHLLTQLTFTISQHHISLCIIFVSKIAPNIYVSKYTFSALTCIIT